MNCKIGRHINISNGFISSVKHAANLGCNIMQIFLGSPQLILNRKRSNYELESIKSELIELNMDMVIHGSYTINLCHNSTSNKYKASLKSLIQDLLASEKIGSKCLGVIIHMGKNVPEINIDDDIAINNYIIGINEALLSTNNSVIILETGASQGNEVGSNIEELAKIYNGILSDYKSRVKFCIDTCHIWATGYNIADDSSVNIFFDKFEKLIGIKNISCIHFNDSKTPLNSHVDRHADIGYGFIGDIGLKSIALFSKKHNIPIIMETPLDSVNKKTNKNISSTDEISKIKEWV